MSLSDCPPSFKLVKLGNPDAERDALNAGIQAMLRCMGANSLPDPTGHAGEYLTTDGSTFSWAPTTGNDRPIVIKKDFHGVTAGDELFYYAVSPLVLNGVSILGNTVGDLVVDVRKVPFGSFPATGGDSICAAAKPTLASAQTLLSTTLTGWDKGVLAGDTLTLHVDSATTVTDFEITLYGTESYLPLSYTGALTDADVGDPVGGSITLSGGDGTYTIDASPVSGTRPAGNGLALVGAVYSDSSGVLTTAATYTWTDRFRSGDGQTLDVPSSITVSAAMVYATWNPLDKGFGITLSNGDSRADSSGGYYSVRSTASVSGKRYFEMLINVTTTGGNSSAHGVSDGTQGLISPNYVGSTSLSAGVWVPPGNAYWNGASLGVGIGAQTIGVTRTEWAIDSATRKVWVRVHGGAWVGGGDPVTGTSPTATLTGSGGIFAMATPFTVGEWSDLVSDPVDMIGTAPSGFTAGL